MQTLKQLSAKAVALLPVTKEYLRQLPLDVHDVIRSYLNVKTEIILWNGESRRYYDNGNIRVQCHYKQSRRRRYHMVLHGVYRQWFPDGTLWAQKHYKYGALHGKAQVYSPNGRLWKICFYKNNRLDGEYKTWSKQGELISHEVIKKGKRIKTLYKR